MTGIIKKGEITDVQLRKARIETPELGEGKAVVVRQMTFPLYQLYLIGGRPTITEEADGRRKVVMPEPGKNVGIVMCLAECVIDDEDQPILDEEGWKIWGMRHPDLTNRIWEKIREISGLDLEAAKKN